MEVQLFMPLPAEFDDPGDAHWHYTTTRNFFAWVLKRDLVGDTLGVAMAELLCCLDGYRSSGVDNLADLVYFLEKQGYWDFYNRPDNALAALYLSEMFRLRGIYVDAFSHCVGMAERLHRSPEYRVSGRHIYIYIYIYYACLLYTSPSPRDS